jgi:hypothetical protein
MFHHKMELFTHKNTTFSKVHQLLPQYLELLVYHSVSSGSNLRFS